VKVTLGGKVKIRPHSNSNRSQRKLNKAESLLLYAQKFSVSPKQIKAAKKTIKKISGEK